AVNGPTSVVVCGAPDELDDLLARLSAAEVRVRRLPVDYASHSTHVEGIRADLLAALADIRPRPAEVPLYSAVTGEPVDGTSLDAEYWYTNLRSPVRFAEATRRLLADGHRLLLEISPHPVLAAPIQEIIEEAGADAEVVASLRRHDGGPRRMLSALGELHVRA